MLASERARYILQQLSEKGIINLKETTAELKTSEATVRRDFEKLEQQGKLKRVLGGASVLENDVPPSENAELTMQRKRKLNLEAKMKIAYRAAACVQDGDCVFLDGGTTTLPMIDILAKKRVKIVTNNHMVPDRLNNPAAEIILLGGTYLPHYQMTVGTMALKMLEQFYFQHAFISCCGVNIPDNAIYTAEIDTYVVKETAAKNAARKYLLIDSGKLSVKAFYKLTILDQFDAVYCNHLQEGMDRELPENFVVVDKK